MSTPKRTATDFLPKTFSASTSTAKSASTRMAEPTVLIDEDVADELRAELDYDDLSEDETDLEIEEDVDNALELRTLRQNQRVAEAAALEGHPTVSARELRERGQILRAAERVRILEEKIKDDPLYRQMELFPTKSAELRGTLMIVGLFAFFWYGNACLFGLIGFLPWLPINFGTSFGLVLMSSSALLLPGAIVLTAVSRRWYTAFLLLFSIANFLGAAYCVVTAVFALLSSFAGGLPTMVTAAIISNITVGVIVLGNVAFALIYLGNAVALLDIDTRYADQKAGITARARLLDRRCCGGPRRLFYDNPRRALLKNAKLTHPSTSAGAPVRH